MVSFCLRRLDDEAKGKVVLSALHSGKEEEAVAAYRHASASLGALLILYSVHCQMDCFVIQSITGLHADFASSSLAFVGVCLK